MVAEIQVKLVAEKFMSEFYFNRAQKPEQIARQLLDLGQYREAAHFAVFGEGEEAAEEVFDLTNNPSRQAEREQLYGRGRSVSVGDIVSVDGVDYLCGSMGWTKLVDKVAV